MNISVLRWRWGWVGFLSLLFAGVFSFFGIYGTVFNQNPITDAQTGSVSICRSHFKSCVTTCGGLDNQICFDSCSEAYENCVKPTVCPPSCTLDMCINLHGEQCPEPPTSPCNAEQRDNCVADCTLQLTDGNGHLDVDEFEQCYHDCGTRNPACQHGELCDPVAQTAYNGCFELCKSIDPTSLEYEQCAKACSDSYPYCPHGGWNTSSSTTSTTSPSSTTSSSSTTGTPSSSSSVGTSSTTGPTGTSSTTTGGSSENFCKENYQNCNNICDNEHIIDGVYGSEHGTCANRCSDTYASCLSSTPPECKPQLESCTSMCETEYVHVPENCDALPKTDNPDTREIENAAYVQCQDRNLKNKEQMHLSKGKCIGACRNEFSQCVEPIRELPQRPDLGPNTCTPIKLGLGVIVPPNGDQKLTRANNDFARSAQIPNTGYLTDELLEQYGATSLFSDVSPYDTSYTPLATLNLQGVMRGYDDGSIRPDEVVTRAELFKVLLHSLEETVYHRCGSYYADIETGSWYEPFINRAHELGFLYPENNRANPASPVHLDEMLLIVSRAFGLESINAADNVSVSQDAMNSKNLLPIWLKNETTMNRWVTRRDLAEITYRYIQMTDTNSEKYAEELYMTIPDFGIYQLPIARSLISEPSSWLPATLNGGAYYQNTTPGHEGEFVLYGHAAFSDQPLDPALNIFNGVAEQMQPGQRIELEVDGILHIYEVNARQVVSGMDIDALANYHNVNNSSAVLFVCNSTPWERVILTLTRIE